MATSQNKRGLIVTIIALGLTLLIVSGVVLVQNLQREPETVVVEEEATEEEAVPTESSTPPTNEAAPPKVDPSTLSSIAIEPFKITVFYTKGTPGFDYSILRTTDGTQYVEFSATDLVGTKCTNDKGIFASIIKSPALPDQTISQTVVVEGTTYGLSLAGKNCTPDASLLEKYQTGFSNGFGQMKALQ